MSRIASLVVPASLLALWIVVTALRLVDPLFLPTPWDVAQSIYRGFYSGQLFLDLVVTMARSLSGFALAVAAGVPVGLLVGRVQILARATQPTIDFFRSIPATALFPLFLFFFGIGDQAKILIVVYACSLIVLVNYSHYRVAQVDLGYALIMALHSRDCLEPRMVEDHRFISEVLNVVIHL